MMKKPNNTRASRTTSTTILLFTGKAVEPSTRAGGGL